MIWLAAASAATWNIPGDAESLDALSSLLESGDQVILAQGEHAGADLEVPVALSGEGTVTSTLTLASGSRINDLGFSGGAPCLVLDGEAEVWNATFVGCQPAVVAEGELILFSGATFVSNYNPASGGAIQFHGQHLAVGGSTFQANSTDQSGGSIAFTGTFLELWDSRFEGEQAQGDGGAIWAVGGDYELYDLDFVDTSAQLKGGALHTEWADGVSYDTNVQNATAAYGGGLSFRGGSHQHNYLVCDGVQADQGGCITAHDTVGLALQNSTLRNNTAGLGGALAVWTNGAVFLERVWLTGNRATTGGAAYLVAGRLDLLRTHLQGTATGVGVQAVVDDLDIQFSTFQSTVEGWALYATCNQVFMSDTTWTRNQGAAFWIGCDGTVRNSLLSENGQASEAPNATVGWSLVHRDPTTLDPDAIGIEPFFADDSLQLMPYSPAVDAGDPLVTDPDGSRSDIGAFGPIRVEDTAAPPDDPTSIAPGGQDRDGLLLGDCGCGGRSSGAVLALAGLLLSRWRRASA